MNDRGEALQLVVQRRGVDIHSFAVLVGRQLPEELGLGTGEVVAHHLVPSLEEKVVVSERAPDTSAQKTVVGHTTPALLVG